MTALDTLRARLAEPRYFGTVREGWPPFAQWHQRRRFRRAARILLKQMVDQRIVYLPPRRSTVQFSLHDVVMHPRTNGCSEVQGVRPIPYWYYLPVVGNDRRIIDTSMTP